jgi:hypothetical protein
VVYRTGPKKGFQKEVPQWDSERILNGRPRSGSQRRIKPGVLTGESGGVSRGVQRENIQERTRRVPEEVPQEK